ncbi:MAG: hypothetical protein H0T43_12995 [Solirubrobacterales bacterium]|nr:hypothetical protein [Solirubrobacterales bacterium]
MRPPTQIYASTLTRREHRRRRNRVRGTRNAAFVMLGALASALTMLAAVAPNLA